jgi:antitoxin PrlF
MRVTSKGQVTIPQDLRRLAGIEPNSDVIFGMENGKITIEPQGAGVHSNDRDRLERFLRTLDAMEGTGNPAVSAADVMSLTRDR